MSQSLDDIFEKAEEIAEKGLVEEVESKLVPLKSFLVKVKDYRSLNELKRIEDLAYYEGVRKYIDLAEFSVENHTPQFDDYYTKVIEYSKILFGEVPKNTRDYLKYLKSIYEKDEFKKIIGKEKKRVVPKIMFLYYDSKYLFNRLKRTLKKLSPLHNYNSEGYRNKEQKFNK